MTADHHRGGSCHIQLLSCGGDLPNTGRDIRSALPQPHLQERSRRQCASRQPRRQSHHQRWLVRAPIDADYEMAAAGADSVVGARCRRTAFAGGAARKAIEFIARTLGKGGSTQAGHHTLSPWWPTAWGRCNGPQHGIFLIGSSPAASDPSCCT